jgi:hypothetical protein
VWRLAVPLVKPPSQPSPASGGRAGRGCTSAGQLSKTPELDWTCIRSLLNAPPTVCNPCTACRTSLGELSNPFLGPSVVPDE